MAWRPPIALDWLFIKTDSPTIFVFKFFFPNIFRSVNLCPFSDVNPTSSYLRIWAKVLEPLTPLILLARAFFYFCVIEFLLLSSCSGMKQILKAWVVSCYLVLPYPFALVFIFQVFQFPNLIAKLHLQFTKVDLWNQNSASQLFLFPCQTRSSFSSNHSAFFREALFMISIACSCLLSDPILLTPALLSHTDYF